MAPTITFPTAAPASQNDMILNGFVSDVQNIAGYVKNDGYDVSAECIEMVADRLEVFASMTALGANTLLHKQLAPAALQLSQSLRSYASTQTEAAGDNDHFFVDHFDHFTRQVYAVANADPESETPLDEVLYSVPRK